MIFTMYAWSLLWTLTFWLASTSKVASMASSRVSGPMMISSFTYLDGRELINFHMTILFRVLFCGSTCLYIFLNWVAYSDMSSFSLCFKAFHFQCHTSSWTLVLNLATNFGTKLCFWSVTSFQCCILYRLLIN